MRRIFFCILLGSTLSATCLANTWSGDISVEGRYFPSSPIDAQQHRQNTSLTAEVEYYHAWNNTNDSLIIKPFIRIDTHDTERSHFDLREFNWLHIGQDYEFQIGINKVFWGVTESAHLVDVINQTDQLEDIRGEEKLGQAMLNLRLIRSWGDVDFFILPYFQPRQFPGKQGRLRPVPLIDTQQARYQSNAKRQHIDWAIRWFTTYNAWDIGLSYFSGTDRNPLLQLGKNAQGDDRLIPYYAQSQQTSLDLQYTSDAWIWKLEILSKHHLQQQISAFVGGFEYTFYGVAESNTDIGLIGEYLFDDRKKSAPTGMDNDLMLGLRIVFNDTQSSEILCGIIQDLDSRSYILNIEANRRLGDQWKASLEAQIFSHTLPSDALYFLRQDNHLRLQLAYYF